MWAVLIVYYAVTAPKTPIALLVITVLLNVIVEILLLVLGLMDPGIIPKILQYYERE